MVKGFLWVVFLLNVSFFANAEESFYLDDINNSGKTQKTTNNFNLDDLGDITLSDKVEKQKSKSSFAKKISGSIATSQAQTSSGPRSTSNFRLRYQEQFGNLKIVLEGNTLSSNIEIDQELRPEAASSDDSLVIERTIEYAFDETELQEAYVSYNIKNIFNLSYGRKKIVWGQFEPFSPIDFVLPTYYSRNTVEFSKLENRVPLENVNLTVNLTPKVAFDAYYFNNPAYDDIVETLIDRPREFFGANGTSADLETTNVTERRGSEAEQYAYRLMFYPSFATFGFTYFKGFDANFIYDFNNIESSSVANVDNFANPNPGFADQESFGFEFAKKINRTTWKLELSRSRSLRELDYSAFDLGNLGSISDFNSANYDGAKADYYSAINNGNDGNLFYVENLDVIAFGFDRVGVRWDVNMALYNVNFSARDEIGERLLQLEEQAFNNEDDDIPVVIPGVNFTRYFSDAKKGAIGLAGGALGKGVGVGLYFKGQIQESFNWLLSFESIDYFSDQNIELLEADDARYESSTTSTGARFALKYSF